MGPVLIPLAFLIAAVIGGIVVYLAWGFLRYARVVLWGRVPEPVRLGAQAFAVAVSPVLAPFILLAAGLVMTTTVFVVVPLYIVVSVARGLARVLARRLPDGPPGAAPSH